MNKTSTIHISCNPEKSVMGDIFKQHEELKKKYAELNLKHNSNMIHANFAKIYIICETTKNQDKKKSYEKARYQYFATRGMRLPRPKALLEILKIGGD